MGGSLRLTSALGKGSTFAFTVNLPIGQEVPEERVEAKARALPAMRVLVVDDNPIAGELMLAMARSWGWGADMVSSGSQALQLVESLRLSGASEFSVRGHISGLADARHGTAGKRHAGCGNPGRRLRVPRLHSLW